MSIQLRGNHTTEDPRLDRIPFFDQRSREFPIATVVPQAIKSKVWRLPRSRYLDQNQEGACVSTGISHELAAQPAAVGKLTMDWARALIYWPAQQEDPWPGGSYPGASPRYEGTSVLAGIKVAQRLGFFDSYRWAFSVDEGLRGIVHEGPAVIALDWDEGLADPQPNGLALQGGRILGGHCVAWIGVLLRHKLEGELYPRDLAVIVQSWGLDHGDRGRIYLDLSDLEEKLLADGEQCFPVGRKVPYSLP